ncbi:MAG: hypothetical protein EB100_07025, partial [Crocinitomicaceae bacterium]|nr:hypothetical protein [Crocinitomicaceae bacterium]
MSYSVKNQPFFCALYKINGYDSTFTFNGITETAYGGGFGGDDYIGGGRDGASGGGGTWETTSIYSWLYAGFACADSSRILYPGTDVCPVQSCDMFIPNCYYPSYMTPWPYGQVCVDNIGT